MDYNPFLPEVRDNPYPYYTYLRQQAPVYEVPGMGFWVISCYEDVFFVLKNSQLFSSAALFAAVFGDLNPFPPEAPSLLSIDPPAHTRQRKLVNRAFTPRRIASLEAHLHEIVRQLLEHMPTHGECDLVSDFTVPFPAIAIAELLGVPAEHRHDFRRWVADLERAASGMVFTETDREGIRQSISEFRAYFQAAIAGYRHQPGDNLLSDLVRAEEENQTLTAEEVLSMALLLLLGGIQTTTHLLGNTILALCRHPEQFAKVRANLALVPQLVEEAVRYDAPIQGLFRQTTQEVEVAGTKLPAGAIVLPLFASANHDERKFPEPERFDILRNPEGHLGFGFGIHFCLGAPLARLEARVALDTLLRRFPHFALKDEYIPQVVPALLRGPQTLPLTFAR